MPKYIIEYSSQENFKDDFEAIQHALNTARNERKLNDNNFRVVRIREQIKNGLVNKYREIEIK